ncbi:MAG: hypothetical protein ACR2PR_11275 [Pseudohongiellaceae bacterium]
METENKQYPNGGNELHEAAWQDDTEKGIALINKDKTLVNGRDKYGATPLHIVAGKGNTDLLTALINAGALINACANRDAPPFPQQAEEAGYPLPSKKTIH